MFSLRVCRRRLGKPTEILSEEPILATDLNQAKLIFRERSQGFSNKQTVHSEQNVVKHWQASTLLSKSQLLVLKRAFPQTVRALTATKKASRKEVHECFLRDAFAITGVMSRDLTLSTAQFFELVKQHRNKRNKPSLINQVEYELVAGWFFRGYCTMTPEQRLTALKGKNLFVSTPEAIRKICKRLKLPRFMQPGRNK